MSSSVIFYSNQQHSQVQTADDTDTVTDSVSRNTSTTGTTDSASRNTATPVANNVVK